jgi:hypothetical protein
MSKKKLLGAILGTGTTAIVAKNYLRMREEAKNEFDPIETTLDGLEKYILDPVGKLSPGQALTAAALLAGGTAAYKGYGAYKDTDLGEKTKN